MVLRFLRDSKYDPLLAKFQVAKPILDQQSASSSSSSSSSATTPAIVNAVNSTPAAPISSSSTSSTQVSQDSKTAFTRVFTTFTPFVIPGKEQSDLMATLPSPEEMQKEIDELATKRELALDNQLEETCAYIRQMTCLKRELKGRNEVKQL